jgi:hypothetical protein
MAEKEPDMNAQETQDLISSSLRRFTNQELYTLLSEITEYNIQIDYRNYLSLEVLRRIRGGE